MRREARRKDARKTGARLRSALTLGKEESGAAAAEFVLVVPLLLLLTFGIIQYGTMFFAYNNMNNAAREGARTLAVGEADAVGAKAVAKSFLLDRIEPHANVVADIIPQSGINFARVTITMPGDEAGAVTYAPSPNSLTARVLMRVE